LNDFKYKRVFKFLEWKAQVLLNTRHNSYISATHVVGKGKEDEAVDTFKAVKLR